MPDEKKAFWTSIPGILVGVAAVITAVTGLYVSVRPTDRDAVAPRPATEQEQAAGSAPVTGPAPGTRPEQAVEQERHPAQEGLFAIRAIIDDPDGYTNVRSMKSVSSDIVARVYRNEEFYTHIQDGNWWQVKTQDGKVGYMHLSRIRLLKDR